MIRCQRGITHSISSRKFKVSAVLTLYDAKKIKYHVVRKSIMKTNVHLHVYISDLYYSTHMYFVNYRNLPYLFIDMHIGVCISKSLIPCA